MTEGEQESCFTIEGLEELVDNAIELHLEFLALWNLIISSYLAMVLKAKG